MHRQVVRFAYLFRTTLTRSGNVQLNQLIQLRLRNLPTVYGSARTFWSGNPWRRCCIVFGITMLEMVWRTWAFDSLRWEGLRGGIFAGVIFVGGIFAIILGLIMLKRGSTGISGVWMSIGFLGWPIDWPKRLQAASIAVMDERMLEVAGQVGNFWS